jgi:hypothetical protein
MVVYDPNEEIWRTDWERLWDMARQRGWTVTLPDDEFGEAEYLYNEAGVYRLTMGKGATAIHLDLKDMIEKHALIGWRWLP